MASHQGSLLLEEEWDHSRSTPLRIKFLDLYQIRFKPLVLPGMNHIILIETHFVIFVFALFRRIETDDSDI